MLKKAVDKMFPIGVEFWAKVIFMIWTISVICYYYYSRGYIDLFRQLGALVFG
jgi:hypothetical protein